MQTIEKIGSPLVQEFIFSNESIHEEKLLISTKEIDGVPYKEIGGQIISRRKAKNKFPLLYHQQGIVYPPLLNLEQSSSEETAKYKTAAIGKFFPGTKSIIDLTGGFGIDSFFFSREFNVINYVEPDQALLSIARHNHKVLGAQNVFHHGSTAEVFVGSGVMSDVCYIDPSRRAQGRKTFLFEDCSPNVTQLLPEIQKISRGLVVKASPLMDISLAIRELGSVFRVIVVAVNNECKEVLYMCRPAHKGEPEIECFDLKDKTAYVFTPEEEREAKYVLSKPLEYIFEPNVAILKAGAFKSIAQRYGLLKLDANTHLYTSNALKSDFPGRIFRVRNILLNRSEVNQALPDNQANLVLRNYPGTTEDLKRSLRIRDGGNLYLIAATSVKAKLFMLADRIK